MTEFKERDLLLAAGLHTFTLILPEYAKAVKELDYNALEKIGEILFSLIETLSDNPDIQESWDTVFKGDLYCEVADLEAKFKEKFKLVDPILPKDSPVKTENKDKPSGYFG